MARISDDVIERLKNEVSLVRLMESQGFELKKHGKDTICRCPFHDDKTPSLVVTPSKNLFHCFGCDAAGSVIDWVMKREGISFRRAVEILQNDIGLISESHEPVKQSTTKQLSSDLVAEQDEQQALKRIIDFYHETLKQSPEALEYLESRGLNNPELINKFKLGFSNRTLAYRLPAKNRKAGAEIRGLLQSVGILRKTGHEHFNGSIVVPIFDNRQGENEQIKEVYGRKILGSKLRKGTAQHLYLPGEHLGIWNHLPLAACDEIILCESLIDAMTFWVNNFRNVTCSYGTNGFTEELLNGLINHNIKRVLIAYDRDEAGNVAADKLADQLKQYNIDCYRVLFPKNMDANEYALKMSPARKSLELVIRKAEPMLAGEHPPGTPAFRPSMDISAKARGAGSEVLGARTEKEQGKPVTKAEGETVLPASPIPTSHSLEVTAEVTDNEIIMLFGSRRYRVRGLKKAMSYEQLKINLCVSDNDCMHVDHLDLYHAKQRLSFIKQASIELGVNADVIKKDLTKVLWKLEQLQDEQIQKTLKPEVKEIQISSEEEQQALDLLRSPDLLNQILNDFNRAGVVGEETNKLVGYLAAVSRKLDDPLAVIIQSTSAAGKSALMNAVLAMIPEEEKIQYSAMTGQSLFYMGETNLKHKILAIAEEEGAENASYAMKLLQSEGELTMASTGKDADGNLTTQEYHVEGPVMLFSTTTAIDLDEELMNRCLVLTVNESREQTKQIHQMQRRKRTMAGLEDKAEKKRILTVHKNAQRLIKPLQIMNPYADQLTFLDDKTRTRRDHEKYLTLIDSIALLHQHQREIKTKTFEGESFDYVEVTLDDIK
ncbi:MAG: CHC2 zinc finger domain-containing protein, partial [Geopsychrobacter sp.]|nr:CHC2 zinc finger domain-containing protein [Geopsychrobacter sp.]